MKYPWKIDCTDKEYMPRSTTQLQAVLFDGHPAFYIDLDHPQWSKVSKIMSDLVDSLNEKANNV